MRAGDTQELGSLAWCTGRVFPFSRSICLCSCAPKHTKTVPWQKATPRTFLAVISTYRSVWWQSFETRAPGFRRCVTLCDLLSCLILPYCTVCWMGSLLVGILREGQANGRFRTEVLKAQPNFLAGSRFDGSLPISTILRAMTPCSCRCTPRRLLTRWPDMRREKALSAPCPLFTGSHETGRNTLGARASVTRNDTTTEYANTTKRTDRANKPLTFSVYTLRAVQRIAMCITLCD